MICSDFSSDENDASIRKTIIEAERNEGDNQKPPKTKDEILPEVILEKNYSFVNTMTPVFLFFEL